MIEIADMRVLVAVVETASFTEAAHRTDTTKSVISRRISEMERELGAPLLDRSARRVRPTEVGAVYYAKCVRILESITAAQDFVSSFQNQVKGRLNVVVPPLFDSQHLGSLLSRFTAAYPDVLLHIDQERSSASSGLHFDAAIRLGELQDSSLVARPLGDIRHRICASPYYLARRGTPTRPEDMAEHDALIENTEEGAGLWRYDADGRWISYRRRERMRSHSVWHLIDAAIDGLGLVIAPDFMVEEPLFSGRLIEVLPDYPVRTTALSVVYPSNRKTSQKLQTFLAFLVENANDLYLHPRVF